MGPRTRRAALAAALFAVFVVSAAPAAKAPSWTGHWDLVTACTSGPCAWAKAGGSSFDLVQHGASITGKATNRDGKTSPVTGTASGATATLVTPASGLGPVQAHLSADGSRFTGTWSTGSTSGTMDGTRRQFTLSGNVFETHCSAKAGTCSKPTPLADVGVTVTGASDDSTSTAKDGSYSLTLPAGSYTVTPTLQGRDFTPVTRDVDLTADAAGVDFATCATPTNATRRTQAARAAADEPFCRILESIPVKRNSHRQYPVAALFKGIGWNPKGTKIEFAWNKQIIKTLSPRATFGVALRSTEWPNRTSAGCSGAFAARQDGVVKALQLKVGIIGQVIWADHDRFFKTGDFACYGDGPLLRPTQGTVIVAERNTLDIFKHGQLGGPLVLATPLHGRLCVDLEPNGYGHVEITSAGAGYQVKFGPGICT